MEAGVSEVVGVRRSQVVGVRAVVYVVVEEERGCTGALWYSHHHVSVWGGGFVVTATGRPFCQRTVLRLSAVFVSEPSSVVWLTVSKAHS